jgi:hypothetical protein
MDLDRSLRGLPGVVRDFVEATVVASGVVDASPAVERGL